MMKKLFFIILKTCPWDGTERYCNHLFHAMLMIDFEKAVDSLTVLFVFLLFKIAHPLLAVQVAWTKYKLQL